MATNLTELLLPILGNFHNLEVGVIEIFHHKTSIMKKVYSSFDSIMVNHLKNILASNHIDCMLKNEWLSGAAGELPPIECWPELWVEETQYERAQTIISQMFEQQKEENFLPSWICSGCGEEIEGQFTACWQCGESRYK